MSDNKAVGVVEDGMLSIAEAVRHSGLGRSSLYELMQGGTLPFAKIQGRRLIPRRALNALLASSLINAPAAA